MVGWGRVAGRMVCSTFSKKYKGNGAMKGREKGDEAAMKGRRRAGGGAEQGGAARRVEGSKWEAVELGIGRDPKGVESLQRRSEGSE